MQFATIVRKNRHATPLVHHPPQVFLVQRCASWQSSLSGRLLVWEIKGRALRGAGK